jgi:cellulose biosynthesis protein BcsQ
MLSERGFSVLAADLDPKCNLTSVFLTQEEYEHISEQGTIYNAMLSFIRDPIDVNTDTFKPVMINNSNKLGLVPGDLRLSLAEDELSLCWPRAGDGEERSFRVLSSLYRVLYVSAMSMDADIILIDVGPNLGSLNRTVLISSDYVITPVAPDIYSLKGLSNLGPRLSKWRGEWRTRLEKRPGLVGGPMPRGDMKPLGYIVMQHSERAGRPVKSYRQLIDWIPAVFHKEVLNDDKTGDDLKVEDDVYCLARIKHYHSLMPMSMETRKPIFSLTPADGAFGSHAESVAACKEEFKKLTDLLIARLDLQPVTTIAE